MSYVRRIMGRKKQTWETTCKECGIPITLTGIKRLMAQRRGHGYCSNSHAHRFAGRAQAEFMAAMNKRDAPERMRRNNPMHMPGIREKMTATLHEIGHRPPFQGGNGKPLPATQVALAEALGWPTEVPIKTGPKKPGIPTCYKVDIANRDLMIAVEVDGGSHAATTRKVQDAKKETFLRGIGWTVLRFSNREVTADLAACVQTVLSTTSKLKGSTLTLPGVS